MSVFKSGEIFTFTQGGENNTHFSNAFLTSSNVFANVLITFYCGVVAGCGCSERGG